MAKNRGTGNRLRLWVWANGSPVKIALHHGEEIYHGRCGPTEEGFSSSCQTWSRDGDVVRREYYSRARDCDGLTESGGEECCVARNLRLREPCLDFCTRLDLASEVWSSIRWPEWWDRGEWERDHSAEAAGY